MASDASAAAEKRHWVRLTRACNQRCLFCHDRGAQNGKALAFEAVKRELAAGRRLGLRRVVLSGGEPTLHPRFLDLVSLARRLGYEHIQTVTNGRRFCYPGFLKEALAAGLDEITFSLHGHTRELHERLTRVPGSFVQAVTALKAALSMPRLIVSVDVVINALNLPVLRELMEFFVALGVREFDLLALVPFGDAWENRSEVSCDLAAPENLSSLRRALELSRRPDLHVFTNRLGPELLEGFEALIQPPEKILDEVRGRRHLFASWLNGGKPPGCAGEPCPHCFLRDFCRDLGSLLKEGSLKAKVGTLCLRQERRGPARPVVPGERKTTAPGGPMFRFCKKRDIVAYAEFFIRARYFVKGRGCRRCAWTGRCAGIAVQEAKAKGFGVVSPVGTAHG
ncbi:MAG: radical SAM protein [Elusimicrobia bacterium]|nr:radical SAM protein [Elusimicrobiota bacterium]